MIQRVQFELADRVRSLSVISLNNINLTTVHFLYLQFGSKYSTVCVWYYTFFFQLFRFGLIWIGQKRISSKNKLFDIFISSNSLILKRNLQSKFSVSYHIRSLYFIRVRVCIDSCPNSCPCPLNSALQMPIWRPIFYSLREYDIGHIAIYDIKGHCHSLKIFWTSEFGNQEIKDHSILVNEAYNDQCRLRTFQARLKNSPKWILYFPFDYKFGLKKFHWKK